MQNISRSLSISQNKRQDNKEKFSKNAVFSEKMYFETIVTYS